MLKQRLLTGIPVAIAMIAAIVFLPTKGLAFVFGLVTLIGAWEWAHLAGCRSFSARGFYVIVMAACLWALLELQVAVQPWLFGLASLWWGLVTIRLYLRPMPAVRSGISLAWLSAGPLVLLPAYLALLYLHARSPSWLLFAFGVVWLADIGAYFAGRRWGKHKLAPSLSPGKSWEGVFGGLALVWLFGLLGILWLEVAKTHWLLFLSAVLFAAVISVVGDLFESLFKREAGCKDSGKILPGHGGVLDRIDSVTAAAPWLAFIVWFF